MATRRGYYRAELMRSVDNIEMCLTHLTRVRDAYDQDHPDIANTVQQCGDGLVLIAETLKKLRDAI